MLNFVNIFLICRNLKRLFLRIRNEIIEFRRIETIEENLTKILKEEKDSEVDLVIMLFTNDQTYIVSVKKYFLLLSNIKSPIFHLSRRARVIAGEALHFFKLL